MKSTLFAALCLLLALALTAGQVSPVQDNPSNDTVQETLEGYDTFYSDQQEDVASGRSSFLNNPGKRMERIKAMLLQASRRVARLRRGMDRIVGQIMENERRLINRRGQGYGRDRLVGQNVRLFEQIEHLRVKIARVQLITAQRVLEIEQSAYDSISDDAAARLRQIRVEPADYWLWRRTHVLSPSELQEGPGEETIRAIYQ